MSGIAYRAAPPATADLVIVGGGIVGAATAFYAARAGLRPVLLERRPALATLTTAAATGSFRLQFDNEEELRLVRRSVALFQDFAAITGQTRYDPAVRRQGYLWLTTTEAGVGRQRRLVAWQRAWGLDDVEILDGDEARRRFPFVGPAVLGARFRAGDGFLDPVALTLGLAAGSEVPIITGCGVTGFRVAGGRLAGVETTAGPIATDAAVIAAGPLSGLLAAAAGVALPIATVRRQKAILPDLPPVPPGAPMTIDEETGTHWRPALGGAFLLHTDPDTPPTPPAEVVPVDPAFARPLLDPASPVAAARVAPFWRAVWAGRARLAPRIVAGQYTMTPDHRPLIGPTPLDGLWVNTGYSGHGVMAGPAGSQTLVGLLSGALAPADNPFRPDRPFAARELAAL